MSKWLSLLGLDVILLVVGLLLLILVVLPVIGFVVGWRVLDWWRRFDEHLESTVARIEYKKFRDLKPAVVAKSDKKSAGSTT